MSDFEKGRKNPETYLLFAQFLVTGCIKSSTWKDNCRINPFSSIVNESDEAITFLILANNWDAWMEQCEKSEKSNGGKPPKVRELEAKQKYMEKDGRGYSYSKEGKNYYNQMFDFVLDDRSLNGIEFDNQLLNHLNASDKNYQENARSKKMVKERDIEVVCRHAGPNKMRKILCETQQQSIVINNQGQQIVTCGTQIVQAKNITNI